MRSSSRQARDATQLLSATGTASANVIAARLLAFSNPATLLSPWHRAEATRMSSEKVRAGNAGMAAAGMELALLPYRMAQVAARPSAWTPGGWLQAWMDAGGLWMGVGNAALRPAKATAVRNQKRLARHTG